VFLLADVADLWLPRPEADPASGHLGPDIGYHRTWPSLAFYAVLLAGLYRTHWRLRVPGLVAGSLR
jgi:hypothetical protein